MKKKLDVVKVILTESRKYQRERVCVCLHKCAREREKERERETR